MTRLLIVAHNDFQGGAGRATRNLHQALLNYGAEQGIESTLWVIESNHSLPRTRVGYPGGLFRRAWTRVKAYASRFLCKNLLESDGEIRSIAWIRTGLAKEINESEFDVILFSWLGDATISIEELGKIHRPVFFFMHDYWFLSAPRHFSTTDRSATQSFSIRRELEKYVTAWIRDRLYRSWPRTSVALCPTTALRNALTESSELLRSAEVFGNTIDSSFWSPATRGSERRDFGLNSEGPIVLFVSSGGRADARKGYKFLLESLNSEDWDCKVQVIVAGEAGEEENFSWGRVVPVGKLNSSEMRDTYRAAHVVALPSLQEVQPLTALEALACGTSVVALLDFGPAEVIARQQARVFLAPREPVEFGRKLIHVARTKYRATIPYVYRANPNNTSGRLAVRSLRKLLNQT